MKFIVNTTNLQTGGALQVAISLLHEWNKCDLTHEFHVFLSPQMLSIIDNKSFKQHIYFYEFNQNPTHNLWEAMFFQKRLTKLERRIKPDAVITVFGPALWTPKTRHLVGFANGYYLFDDSSFIQDKVLTNFTKRLIYYSRRGLLFHQLKKEADQYWVETSTAHEKLTLILGEEKSKIHIIGNTYGEHLEADFNGNSKSNAVFSFLFLSAYYPHKNFEIIPKVIKTLRKKGVSCQFIVTLAESDYNRIFEEETTRDYVKNIGPVKPSEIAAVYMQSDAVFMPSLLETFSANFPEAMKMKKPILCTHLDFAQGICGNAALYFDPEDEIDIANKIEGIIQNEVLRLELVEAGLLRLEQMETASLRAEKLLHLLQQMSFSSPSNE